MPFGSVNGEWMIPIGMNSIFIIHCRQVVLSFWYIEIAANFVLAKTFDPLPYAQPNTHLISVEYRIILKNFKGSGKFLMNSS